MGRGTDTRNERTKESNGMTRPIRSPSQATQRASESDRPDRRSSPPSELEVLQAISRAFGSSADAREAVVAAVRWVRAAVADEDAGVRIFLTRSDGQLAPALPRIEVADDPERVAERHRVLESRRPARAPLPDGRLLLTIPLISRGELVGVLDVTAAEAAAAFAEIAGVPVAETAVTANAVLAVGGLSPGGHAPFRLVEGLLEDVIDHLAVVEAAARRHERLDLGLALTAHEVRGPLVGALAIIERLLMEHEHDEEDRGLLDRSREQLEQLSRLVDSLLHWAVAGRPLEMRATDLTGLVRQAADWCARETGTDRTVVTGPDGIEVLADADHLRGAMTNVIRNAILYSPPETEVSVRVEVDGNTARVTVRDQGPGVPVGERDSIFDPFMRGAAAYLSRTGNGLGLFITRRVLRVPDEGHAAAELRRVHPLGAGRRDRRADEARDAPGRDPNPRGGVRDAAGRPADPPGAPGPEPLGRGQRQRRDRQPPVRQREHRPDPRPEHPDEARCPFAPSGRGVRRSSPGRRGREPAGSVDGPDRSIGSRPDR